MFLSLTKGQCLKRQTSLSISAVHQPLFIFRFVYKHCLRSTLRLFPCFVRVLSSVAINISDHLTRMTLILL